MHHHSKCSINLKVLNSHNNPKKRQISLLSLFHIWRVNNLELVLEPVHLTTKQCCLPGNNSDPTLNTCNCSHICSIVNIQFSNQAESTLQLVLSQGEKEQKLDFLHKKSYKIIKMILENNVFPIPDLAKVSFAIY